jgi:hypothetical protein
VRGSTSASSAIVRFHRACETQTNDTRKKYRRAFNSFEHKSIQVSVVVTAMPVRQKEACKIDIKLEGKEDDLIGDGVATADASNQNTLESTTVAKRTRSVKKTTNSPVRQTKKTRVIPGVSDTVLCSTPTVARNIARGPAPTLTTFTPESEPSDNRFIDREQPPPPVYQDLPQSYQGQSPVHRENQPMVDQGRLHANKETPREVQVLSHQVNIVHLAMVRLGEEATRNANKIKALEGLVKKQSDYFKEFVTLESVRVGLDVALAPIHEELLKLKTTEPETELAVSSAKAVSETIAEASGGVSSENNKVARITVTKSLSSVKPPGVGTRGVARQRLRR